jgi:hypothetical protein
MATPLLPEDFKEFLRLLNANKVEYLLIGGYAVGYYGYARATADMDVWIAPGVENAARTVSTLREFGFDVPELSEELLLEPDNILRMGIPPFRLEVLSSISGVSFAECYAERVVDIIDDVDVPIISLLHLRINKKASGRLKDLTDLEHLPEQ